jgi:hypothetical protein
MIWMEGVVTKSRYYPGTLERTEENHSQNIQCPGQDSNWVPLKYKSEWLLPEQNCSVWLYDK